MNPILYAEDEEDDVFFVRKAFEQVEIPNPMVVLPDGTQAIAYLSATANHSNENGSLLPPVLALLDINLPGKSGLEVLKWIRAQPALCTLPVIMLTSSIQEADVHRAYTLGANGFLQKPGKPQELVAMVRSLKDFWLTHNRTVQNSRAG
jgi:CheY-like chemotaxis protein